ncbi:MAG: hypothetical protein L3J22_02170 [Xanthomonadales bacterium]|nr:hypothetical protein [Xanthomonadales bacterium]
MTLPRKQLISIEETPYYHIISRCVRRAFLCGSDPITNRCYEHRRKWIKERVKYLAGIFSTVPRIGSTDRHPVEAFPFLPREKISHCRQQHG